jgi:dTDP-4-amino-4,6-dideoxygalactose transaminase
MKIPFNNIFLTGKEEEYIKNALNSGRLSGNNTFGNKVIDLMKKKHSFNEVFLTPSGTAALEMGALLANISHGDEVIIPSYTFSSTVNAIVIFGAIPVFCEIDEKTMNIDVTKIESLITKKTKMIIPIDYAGISCEIDKIMEIANRYDIIVMQDSAQSYGAYYNKQACGSQAHLATFSFHETKNFCAGEGGALIVNKPEWIERAHFIQEKGTDRSLVIKGLKSKYHWVDKGSSYLLSELNSAMLLAQLENEDLIKSKREILTRRYNDLFSKYARVKRMSFPDNCSTNHHAFWVIFDTIYNQELFISMLKEYDIYAYIGYIPLHSSLKGKTYGYEKTSLPLTEDLASKLVRLPFYTGINEEELEYCISTMKKVLDNIYLEK